MSPLRAGNWAIRGHYWGFTLILAFSPQGRRDPTAFAGGTLTLTLSQRARGSEHLGVKFQISGSFGSIWPRLLLAARLEMRPPRPHLATALHTAHSPLCPMRPRWPRLASSGVARSGEPLIQLHLVAFRCISRTLTLTLSRARGSERLRGRLGRVHYEWPGVAKLLIQLHSVAFRCISYSSAGRGFTPP